MKQDEIDANGLLKWEFSFTTGWMWVHGGTGEMVTGNVTVTNTLDKKKFFDNTVLPDYRVHLDASIKKDDWDWSRSVTNDKWYQVASATVWNVLSKDAMPDPPSLNLEVFDIDFFMTTNLLLPNSKVIEFKADPGVRFPRDLYLVGQIVHEDKVNARRAAPAT